MAWKVLALGGDTTPGFTFGSLAASQMTNPGCGLLNLRLAIDLKPRPDWGYDALQRGPSFSGRRPYPKFHLKGSIRTWLVPKLN